MANLILKELEPYKNYIDNELTSNFLKKKPSKWLPYVGKDYKCSPNRILIVGLSHYDKQNNPKWTECLEGTTPNIESIVSNGLGIYNQQINGNKMFRGLERVFFNVSQGELKMQNFNNKRRKMWSSLSFYQLIETAMNSSKHDKHIEREEMTNGIAINKLIDVIKILSPTNIIMLSNSYKYHSELERLSFVSEDLEKRIYEAPIPNKTDIRTCYFTMNNYQFTFSAIIHPSRYKYIDFQNSLLQKTIPDFLNYIRAVD